MQVAVPPRSGDLCPHETAISFVKKDVFRAASASKVGLRRLPRLRAPPRPAALLPRLPRLHRLHRLHRLVRLHRLHRLRRLRRLDRFPACAACAACTRSGRTAGR